MPEVISLPEQGPPNKGLCLLQKQLRNVFAIRLPDHAFFGDQGCHQFGWRHVKSGVAHLHALGGPLTVPEPSHLLGGALLNRNRVAIGN